MATMLQWQFFGPITRHMFFGVAWTEETVGWLSKMASTSSQSPQNDELIRF